MITTHPAYPQLKEIAEREKKSIHIGKLKPDSLFIVSEGWLSNMYTVLAEELEKLRQKVGAETLTEVTKDMHLYPDLHGKPNHL